VEKLRLKGGVREAAAKGHSSDEGLRVQRGGRTGVPGVRSSKKPKQFARHQEEPMIRHRNGGFLNSVGKGKSRAGKPSKNPASWKISVTTQV